MKKLFTCLEEKRVLVCALASLVALTVLAAAAAYQVKTGNTEETYVAEQTNAEEDGQDVAAVQGEPQTQAGLTEQELVPNAEEVGNQTLVNEQGEPQTQVPVSEEEVPVQAGQVAAMNLTYDGSSRLCWPVESRNILREYSMDSTVYHATLNQYRVSRGILIQEEPGRPVFAPADCLVTEIGTNEEIGNYVILKLGDAYSATLGNLSDITVAANQYILQGTVVGMLAEPTKYCAVEGPNLYFEVRNADTAVDPLAYLE